MLAINRIERAAMIDWRSAIVFCIEMRRFGSAVRAKMCMCSVQ